MKRDIGFALREAQRGVTHPSARPLRGFGGAAGMEISAPYDGDAYRAVYTAEFQGVIDVLHVFKKKSKRGIDMARLDRELIQRRLNDAFEDFSIRVSSDKE